ncbi:MAG: enhanced serine sensitivity protein SseB [Ruminococcus sp.]|nr:enhanced serine sensitivity protein SseB [Ruminococcus sp.]
MSENNLKVENSRIPAEKIKNPALVAAIETMQADGSKQNIDAMITECVKAKFILPANVRQIPNAHTENGKTIMGSSTQVQFRLLENNQTKQKFFGVFTDVDELNKWNGVAGAQKVVTDFDSIAGMVMDPKSNTEGFVINAFGKSVTFPKPMVIGIKQQYDYMRRKKNIIESGTQVRIGEPKEYPIDLMATLINHFSTEPYVNAAFLRMIEKDGKVGYFIVVDFIGDMNELFEGIAEAAKPYIDDEEALTIMPYTMEFARNAVKEIEPFYKRDPNA